MQVRYDPKSLIGNPIDEGGTFVFYFSAMVNGEAVIPDSLELQPK
jgi:hypothetical protein